MLAVLRFNFTANRCERSRVSNSLASTQFAEGPTALRAILCISSFSSIILSSCSSVRWERSTRSTLPFHSDFKGARTPVISSILLWALTMEFSRAGTARPLLCFFASSFQARSTTFS